MSKKVSRKSSVARKQVVSKVGRKKPVARKDVAAAAVQAAQSAVDVAAAVTAEKVASRSRDKKVVDAAVKAVAKMAKGADPYGSLFMKLGPNWMNIRKVARNYDPNREARRWVKVPGVRTVEEVLQKRFAGDEYQTVPLTAQPVDLAMSHLTGREPDYQYPGISNSRGWNFPLRSFQKIAKEKISRKRNRVPEVLEREMSAAQVVGGHLVSVPMPVLERDTVNQFGELLKDPSTIEAVEMRQRASKKRAAAAAVSRLLKRGQLAAGTPGAVLPGAYAFKEDEVSAAEKKAFDDEIHRMAEWYKLREEMPWRVGEEEKDDGGDIPPPHFLSSFVHEMSPEDEISESLSSAFAIRQRDVGEGFPSQNYQRWHDRMEPRNTPSQEFKRLRGDMQEPFGTPTVEDWKEDLRNRAISNYNMGLEDVDVNRIMHGPINYGSNGRLYRRPGLRPRPKGRG